jgi:outer membrane protein assembly factor BamC
LNVKLLPVATPVRCAVLALVAGLAGCSSIDGFLSGDKVDYRNSAAKTKPLEVPPDLTQLARDPRYAPQGGVISAAATPQTPTLQPGSAALTSVAPSVAGKIRVEKQGQQRWLVAEAPPEAVYPAVRDFWQERGFALTTDNAQAGVMETDWVENRAKLPNDLIRSTLGRLVDRLYDTGERDRFRTRIERGANGTEIYLTHRGLEEVYSGERKENAVWRPRDNDPQLESEILTRLLVHLGSKDEAAKTAVVNAPEAPARARALGGVASMEVDEPFDRAWRRVGLALDRSGYTVEDRDRSAGLFYVRYVDPKVAGLEEPNFFARLFGAKGPDRTPVRYRVALKGEGTKTTVAVQSSAGAPEAGDAGKAIVAQLVRELR